MELTAERAAEMSRAEALRALATAEGVPAADRRLALIMLEGPEITGPVARPRRQVMAAAVSLALLQYQAEVDDDRAAARAEVRELAGGL